MMSKETSSEWLLRRKAELAAKDLNTKDRCSNIMVLNVHFQVPALKYTRSWQWWSWRFQFILTIMTILKISEQGSALPANSHHKDPRDLKGRQWGKGLWMMFCGCWPSGSKITDWGTGGVPINAAAVPLLPLCSASPLQSSSINYSASLALIQASPFSNSNWDDDDDSGEISVMSFLPIPWYS